MSHDVFISYSSKDKPSADAVCAVLERNAIRCWIAPRDILPGRQWGASIIEAIHNAKVFILLFSENANSSQQIEREVERAINRGLPVLPVRIQEVQPTNSLEYFISSSHWLDAFTHPFEQHLGRVADAVRRILQIDQPAAPDLSPAAAKQSESAPPPALTASQPAEFDPAPVGAAPPPPVPPAARLEAGFASAPAGATATPKPRSRSLLWYAMALLAVLALGSAVTVWRVRSGSQSKDYPLTARVSWKQTNQTIDECMKRARDAFRDFKVTNAASETFFAMSDDYTFVTRCTSTNLVFFSLVAPADASVTRDRYAMRLYDDVIAKW
jgi:hypothetical protein